MRIKYAIKVSLNVLKTNRSRSVLTILGIVIGITSIILIMAIGQGAQNLILKEVEGFGAKSIVIIPGQEPKGITDSFQTLFSDSIGVRELEAIKNKNNVPDLDNVMPIVFGSYSMSHGRELYRGTVLGTSEIAERIYNLELTDGFFFDDDDIKSRTKTLIIGQKVKEELFGQSDAVGQILRIKGNNFRIQGVIEKQGAGSFFNFDEAVFTPYSTAQQYLFGEKTFHRILVEAKDEESVFQMKKDIEITLRNLHKIDDPEKDDFFIQTQDDIINTIGTITNVLTLFLTSVAAISLIVGGIGIMNIMLVSVVERTREIGLRKAVGATKADILIQFLIESVMLTIFGGIIGIIFGTLLAWGTSLALSSTLGSAWDFVFPVFPATLGLLVAAGVGLIFGIYPANQASKKSPIEALRYE